MCETARSATATAPDRRPDAATVLLMILAPNQIAHVDIAAAQRAACKMLGLASWRPGVLADDGAAWPRFVDWRDRHLITSKKYGLGIASEAIRSPRDIHPAAGNRWFKKKCGNNSHLSRDKVTNLASGCGNEKRKPSGS
jgi:hypothetical protein